ncbi:hypothetical protein [Massilia sp. Dwa41.01b]|uniref:hypothetical protein n=1 Tax=Massilia sp. Dwa41.01b TaxID=2709302 RepID=UPI001E64AA31|nr:hypothetical protein [Massilia sp. Dwa41.01b]
MNKLMLTLAISMMFAPAAFAAPAADEAQSSAKAAAPAAKLAAMPAYGKDKPIPTPKIAKKTLANGMTVWVVPRRACRASTMCWPCAVPALPPTTAPIPALPTCSPG